MLLKHLIKCRKCTFIETQMHCREIQYVISCVTSLSPDPQVLLVFPPDLSFQNSLSGSRGRARNESAKLGDIVSTNFIKKSSQQTI